MTERAEPVAFARRDGSSGGADPGTASARAAEPSVRRFDGPRLALAAIRIGPGLMLVVVVLVVATLSPVFLTTRNVGNVLSQSAVIAVLALAQLLVIITRGIDLSVGSTLALSAVVGALVFESASSGTWVIVAMLVTGTLVGAVNGTALVYGRLPHPFIVTLATLSVARGLALWLSGGQPIQGMPPIIQELGGGSIGWFPISAFLVTGLALLTLLLTTRLVWGPRSSPDPRSPRWAARVAPERSSRGGSVSRAAYYLAGGSAAPVSAQMTGVAMVTTLRTSAGDAPTGDLPPVRFGRSSLH